MKRPKTYDNQSDSGKPHGYHRNHDKPPGYHHDDHHCRDEKTAIRGPSDGTYDFSGKPHGYHQGKGGYPRG